MNTFLDSLPLNKSPKSWSMASLYQFQNSGQELPGGGVSILNFPLLEESALKYLQC